jgi:hypothetical protein
METVKVTTEKPKISRPKPLSVIPQQPPPTQENINKEPDNILQENEPLGIKTKPARGKKPITEMEYMQSKMKQQPLTIEDWVKARIQFPKFFKFTEEGDLEVPAIRPSDTKKIIRFEKYIPATDEYINNFLKNRQNAIIEPEKEYTIAKRRLQELVMMFDPNSDDITIDDILDANEEVKEKECILNELVKMPRNINVSFNLLKEGDLNFDIYAKKTVAEPVVQAEYTSFPIEAFWMPQGEQLVENDNTVLPTKISLDDESDNNNYNNDYNNNDNNQSGGKTNRIVTDRIRGIIGARARAGHY